MNRHYRNRDRDHEFYPESRPIPTDRGLKARSKRGGFAESWWARRWIESLEALLDAGRLRRGRRYARQGQVLSIEEKPGGVTAEVQGSRRRPYRVEVELEALTDEQWEEVFEALSERALFTARLLSGEMPEDIEEAFSAASVSLFPERSEELRTGCTCPDPAEVCKHKAAVHYLLAERFDEDPFLLFRLRGRTMEQVTHALRQRRGEEEAAEAEPLEDAGQKAPPLVEQMDHFWKAGGALESVNVAIKPPAVELSVLRRLGQPNFTDEDLPRLLGKAYESISRGALEEALGEPMNEEER